MIVDGGSGGGSGGHGKSSVGTYGGLKIRMSIEQGRRAVVRSAQRTSESPNGGASSVRFWHAFRIVSAVAWHALGLMSTPRVRMSCRPRRVRAWAAMNARTTPEPVPTSRIVGIGACEGGNLALRNSVSGLDDRVSRRRKESSAGS